jgi:DNA-binding NarL/FixJ family response regulator
MFHSSHFSGSTSRPLAAASAVCRVAVVEDMEGIRAEMVQLIESFEGFTCAQTCVSAEEALKVLPALAPDVVLMDIYLPRMSGIECTQRLKVSLPSCQIVMLTSSDEEELIFRALEAGADGYLLKDCAPEDLRQGLLDLRRGGVPMTSGIARRVVHFFRHRTKGSDELRSLSQRETEVLGLIARGLSTKEVGDRLSLSIETIRTYVKNIYEKMHVHSRAEAVAKYFENSGRPNPPQHTGDASPPFGGIGG